VLAEQGDLGAARPLLERAVVLRERQLGPHDPDVATELGNLGLVLQGLGELAAAREVFERALAIQLAATGGDEPQVGAALANLARLRRRQLDVAGSYVTTLPRQAAERALLADELGGTALSVDHGAPWRLIVPGGACYTSVKWVDRLELSAS
jgi:hypothetical protein